MVMRMCSHAHTLTVGIHINTSGPVFFISVRNMVEFMVVISLLHSSAALQTVDVLSTPVLLWQGTRDVHMDLFLYLVHILHNIPLICCYFILSCLTSVYCTSRFLFVCVSMCVYLIFWNKRLDIFD